MNIEALNAMDENTFTQTLGWIYEDSPWVAKSAWRWRPFKGVDSLHRAMMLQVARAAPGKQLALLRAHPDLGTRAKLSAASAGEQTGAGLDQLTGEEFELFNQLNERYKVKFGFPFLYAVQGSSKQDVLRALEQRLPAARQEEFREALSQVFRIAGFRLSSLLGQGS